ncbi:ZIP family metal transporter [Patescibacteria group bacterium]|nr:ZIP family metal transporter [Patescibacteria group bacterium]
MLINILFFTFLASIVSLFLVSILLLKEKLIHRFSFSLVSFAAGALLATAFLDTMKEALEIAGNSVFLWVTLSFAAFFIIERLFVFLHHHDEDIDTKDSSELKIPTPFLLFGDALHNFIDGTSIAASFMVSFPLGLVTSTTVFVHEIPHELGDFGILIHKGWGRGKVLWFNVATGFAAVIGAVLAFYLGHLFEQATPILLAITTGNFLYLSATNLVPEIHNKAKQSLAAKETIFFLLGILLIASLIKVLG